MPAVSPSQPGNVRGLPRADGRNFLVTGGNAGIGYFVAEQLAQTGATVVLGSRSAARAEAALASLRSRIPGARVRHLPLDPADLGSLKSSAEAPAALGPAHLDAGAQRRGGARRAARAGRPGTATS
ncbi:hypothetical protein GCM10009863_21980 [Streptomyces axinellae]|uniref:SDR family NAD(P)-dependent oxidoreductase n=1 Tax=Streptomyces axinellae TaxID=552788 RepID=A0ABN3PY82_9ACTN